MKFVLRSGGQKEVLVLDVIGWKIIVKYSAVQRSGFA